jgi:hypothetical protein
MNALTPLITAVKTAVALKRNLCALLLGTKSLVRENTVTFAANASMTRASGIIPTRMLLTRDATSTNPSVRRMLKAF